VFPEYAPVERKVNINFRSVYVAGMEEKVYVVAALLRVVVAIDSYVAGI
jgi:hypothetical protein